MWNRRVGAVVLVAQVACIASATGSPASAQDPGLTEVTISGLPPVWLPSQMSPPGFDAVVAAADAAMRDLPEAGATTAVEREWVARRRTAIDSLRTMAQSQPTPDARRVAMLVMAFVFEDTAARMRRAVPRDEQAVHALVVACGALPLPEIQPWVDRCRALASYWDAMEAFRRGPVWPEECAPPATTATSPVTGPPTLALVMASTSLRPALETHRLRESIVVAARSWFPDLRVLGADELEQIERRHADEQAADGSACVSGDLTSAYRQAHGRVWLGRIAAICPLHGQTGTCELTVSFSAEGEDAGLPAERHADLGIAGAGIDEFIAAVPRLVARPRLSRFGRFGAVVFSDPAGRIWGFSTSIEAMEVVGVLAPTRGPLLRCRDLDASAPGAFDAALALAPDGQVTSVSLTGQTRGARRRACVERVFGALRFRAASDPVRIVIVSGEFGVARSPRVSVRIAAASDVPVQPDARVADALIACRPAGDIQTSRVRLEVAPDGTISRSTPVGSSRFARCVARGLSRAVTTCGPARSAEAVVCIGAPVVPARPGRP